MRKTLEDRFFEDLGGFPVTPSPQEPVESVEEDSDIIDDSDFDSDDLTSEKLAAAEEERHEDAALEKYAQRILARPVTRSNLFSHSESHPYVLDLALIKQFQLEWLSWEADTLFREIELTFKTSIAEVNRLKILATSTLHVSDAFWDRWEVFEKAVLALNGVIPRTGYMQPPDIAILMAGVDIANSIRKEEYGEEVARYVAAVMLNEHVSYAPPPLDFSSMYLCDKRYKCGECGKDGSALPPFDGHCDACARKFEDEKPLNFKPHPEAKDDPKKISYYCKLDPEPTKKRFEELIALPPDKVVIDETADDVEAARLIAATDYMHFRRQQRDLQLSQIKDWMIQ